jgi:hypothetical protein
MNTEEKITRRVVDVDGRVWTQASDDPNHWHTTITAANGDEIVIDSSADNLRDEFGVRAA